MMNSRKHTLRLPASPGNQFIKSPRYSHIETGPSRSMYNNSITGSPLNHKLAGPLLASTPISYSLSTYMDSKSPGLSERVVQYSNETQECRATHQTKYKMPGVFPVIHLFKKNLPIRRVTPSKVTMQVTMQESAIHNMESMNTSEDITQATHSRTHHDDRETSIGTHSVLDALKEISRKRIHSGDHCLQPNNYKRNRRECYIDSADTKTSNESVSSDSSTMKSAVQLSKIPCFLNDITASLSSSSAYALHQQKSPPKPITQAVEDKIAHSNAETQTDAIPLEVTNKSLENDSNKPEVNPTPSVESLKETDQADCDTEVSSIVDPTNTPKKSVVDNTALYRFSPVFNEMPAEEIRKGKMEVLLSALTGRRSKAKPKSNEIVKTDLKSEEPPPQEIKPVSIMSHHDKPKHDKHVTFVIPEKENIVKETLETNSSVSAPVISKDNIDTIKLQFETSPSLSNKINPEPRKDEVAKSTSDSIPVRPVLFSTEVPSIPKPIISTIKVPEVPFSNEPKIQEVKIETPKANPVPPVLSASKLGGFKFDFQKTESAPSKPSMPSISLSSSGTPVKPLFSFANTSSNNNLTTVYSTTNLKSSHTPTSSFSGNINFNFTSTPKLNTTTGVSTTDTGFKAVAFPQFSSPPAFNTNTTVTSTFGTGIFSTGLNTNTAVAAPLPSSNTPTPFSNSVPPNITIPSGFGVNQVFNKNPPQDSGFKFTTTPNNPMTAASIFSTPTLSSTGLGQSNSSFSVPNSFNKTATTTAPAPPSNMFSFVSNTAKEPIVPSSLSGFAVPASTNAVFNPTPVPSLFSKPTTDPPSFGQTISNAFGQPSVFGGEAAQQKPTFDASTSVTNSNPFRSNMFSSDTSNFKSNTFEFNVPPKTAFNSLNVPQSGMLPVNAPHTTAPPSTAFGTMFSAGSQPSNNFPSESVFGNNPTATSSANVIGNAPNPPFNSPAFGNFPPAFNAPTAGTFNIGTGPPGSKPRTHLKARRRT